MRYLKPHFYDKFVCTAGDCPDTCCAGWQIMIDEASLDRYGKETGEFGTRLRNSIESSEPICPVAPMMRIFFIFDVIHFLGKCCFPLLTNLMNLL